MLVFLELMNCDCPRFVYKIDAWAEPLPPSDDDHPVTSRPARASPEVRVGISRRHGH